MDRRALLKNLALASLSAIGQKAFNMPMMFSPAGKPTLNLVLHGLFAMEFTDSNIRLMTPFVSMHRYLASSWNLDDQKPMPPGNSPMTLAGVDTTLPVFDPRDPKHKLDRALILSKSELNFIVDKDQAYLTVELPWPLEIKLLRFAKRDPVPKPNEKPGSNIFKVPPLDKVTELSLCQVVRYPITDLAKLKLTGTTWQGPKQPSPDNTVNLHLWAEPDQPHMPPSHATEAYNQLGKLLPKLNFALASSDVTVDLDDDTGVTGMAPEEEMGLSEWLHWGEGTSGSNCGNVMVVR